MTYQSFLTAAITKPTEDLRAILSDPERLKKAAEYHGDWARMSVEHELGGRK